MTIQQLTAQKLDKVYQLALGLPNGPTKAKLMHDLNDLEEHLEKVREHCADVDLDFEKESL